MTAVLRENAQNHKSTDSDRLKNQASKNKEKASGHKHKTDTMTVWQPNRRSTVLLNTQGLITNLTQVSKTRLR